MRDEARGASVMDDHTRSTGGCFEGLCQPSPEGSDGVGEAPTAPLSIVRSGQASRLPRFGRIMIVAVVAVVVVLLAWFQPAILLEAGDRVGYAICHQIPERSFYWAGRPLPLCARCTGTFLGVALGFGMIAWRRRVRCGKLPPFPVLLVMATFLVIWALDGLNSYLTLFEHLPHLYEPRNLVRMATGMLNGLALSALVYPVFSLTVWAEPTGERSVENIRELAIMLALAGALVSLIWIGWFPLVYVLSLMSVLGALLLLLVVNTLIVVIALRRENRAHRWRELGLPAAIGVLITSAEIALMNALRAYLTSRLGLPF